MIIYKIESLIDSRVYIGQTTQTLSARIHNYKSDIKKYIAGKYRANSYIIRAMVEYGFENFRIFVIDRAHTQVELDAKEQLWIYIYNSTVKGIGFNIQHGGFGTGKHSLETRRKMSLKKAGKPAHNKGKSGPRPANAKLSNKDIEEIKKEYSKGFTSRDLAKKFGVSKTTIQNAVNDTYYKVGKPITKTTWYVYLIVSSKDASIYTGITVNVDKRIKKHNENKGARYTKGRGPFTLLKFFTCVNKSEALRLEYKIKQLSRDEKLAL